METIYKEILVKKIKDLFTYRMFPQLLELGCNDVDVRVKFNDQLIDLQTSIYYLDAHLEEDWNLSDTIKKERWAGIFNSLHGFNISDDQVDEYCAHIYKYEKREIGLRKKNLPLHLKLEYFYFYKSCDVKLCRRLIYEHFPEVRKHMSLADWRYFDLVTEINDDVEDLFEDLETINCNRFMISIGINGIDKTRQDFLTFLEELELRNNERFSGDLTPWQKEIKKKTNNNIQETKQLVISNLNVITQDQIDKSKLFLQLLK